MKVARRSLSPFILMECSFASRRGSILREKPSERNASGFYLAYLAINYSGLFALAAIKTRVYVFTCVDECQGRRTRQDVDRRNGGREKNWERLLSFVIAWYLIPSQLQKPPLCKFDRVAGGSSRLAEEKKQMLTQRQRALFCASINFF